MQNPNQLNSPNQQPQPENRWEELENNPKSNHEIDERPHKMIIASLRGVLERRSQAISEGKQPAMPDEYYKIVEARLEKYDANHHNNHQEDQS